MTIRTSWARKCLQKRLFVPLVAAATILFAAAPASAQFDPPPGSHEAPLLLSPYSLGRGPSVTSAESPRADAINPAASGAEQRTVLDAGYTGITGFGVDGQGWDGHAASLGATFPTRRGVFTGGMHFLSSTMADFNLGTGMGLKFSYARDVWDEFDVGAGINLDVGGADDRLAAGATLDIGMIYRPTSLFGVDGARFGAAMRGMGYGYRPLENRSSVPSVFTPTVGLAFPLIRTDNVLLEVSGDVSAPSFQDGRVDVGTSLSLFDVVDIHAGWGVGGREVFESDRERASLLPSVGVSVNFGADFRERTEEDSLIARQGWDQNEVRTRVAARPLYGSTWAFATGLNVPLGVIDEQPPEVSITYPETQFIGPNNSGVKDDLTLPIEISDEERTVEGYTLKFAAAGDRSDAAGDSDAAEESDGAGDSDAAEESGTAGDSDAVDGSADRLNTGETVVRTIENRSEAPSERSINGFFEQLTRVDRGIDIPESIRWNGRDEEGAVVPDGEYTFVLEAWDDNGNRGSSEYHTVVVDTEAPTASVSTPLGAERSFSPNDDGTRDAFPIEQEGSVEEQWNARMENTDGETVRTWRWEDSQPQPLEWDGLDDSGEFAADGVYSYHLEATDRAGNRFDTRLGNIVLDTEPRPVDIAIGSRYLAPTGNGVNDTVMLTLDVPIRENMVSWELSIVDQQGREVFDRSGTADGPPDEYEFRGRNDQGNVLEEGEYHAVLRVSYRNGSEPTAESARFTVDTTPPSVAVSKEESVFAPTGDGNRDTMILYNEATGGTLWTGRILDSNDEEVYSTTWNDSAPTRWEWDGRTQQGSLADDGEYRYELEGVDAAGNRATSDATAFRMNTEDTDVLVTAEHDAFSPVGRRDTVGIFPELRTSEGVEQYRVTIVNEDNEPVRSFSGTEPPERIDWEGIDRDGRSAPDGAYRALLEVDYETGVTAEAETSTFRLDTEAPDALVDIDERLFSPDGRDGRQSVTILQEGTGASEWTGRIRDAAGEVVYTETWSGEAEDFEWNGRDDAGNTVGDGEYSYELEGSDEAGNTAVASLEGITVDTRRTRVFVTVGAAGFSPTGTGEHEEIDFELLVSPSDGVEQWRLDITNRSGDVVRTFSGEQIGRREEIIWDGEDDEGSLVDGGNYRARLEVEYEKGNTPRSRSSRFEVVTEAPQLSVELDHTPFTPDGISGPDEVGFEVNVDTITEIAEWELEIRDRNDRFFNEFYGTGMPASVIRWDGRASDGDTVISAEDYPYTMRVVDRYGNEAEVSGAVPIGIMLERDGDRYKMQIPSITFEPNSPDLVTDPDDPRGVQNNAVLERLVEIFDRYEQYDVTIEGHAVNLTGTEREENDILEPLSRDRAQSVKEGLVDRGMSASRIEVVGRGGRDPMVPHDDLDERWRNRRVDFILER
ncbi:MAG: FlgD immunoglobulin-like domain containing protein [Spirochaetota bacterium]